MCCDNKKAQLCFVSYAKKQLNSTVCQMLNLHTKKNGSLCQSLNFHFLAYNKIRKSIKHNTRVLAAFQKTSMKCWNMKPKGRELSRWVEIKEALVLLCSVMRPVTVMYCSIRSELVMLERITFVMMHWIRFRIESQSVLNDSKRH